MSGPVSRVVLVGQDAPLWLAASVIRAALAPAGVTVEVVSLPSTIDASHVYVTQPALEALHNILRISETNLLRATRGSFSLGQRFIDGAGMQPPFFHAYGSHGAPVEGKEFLAYWLKARRHGLAAAFGDFSLTQAAALNGRMLLPDADTEIFGRTDYGYHLPAAAYARSLRALVKQDGTIVHETAGLVVEKHDNGAIAAVGLDDGLRVAGDFFVDASDLGLLIGHMPGTEWLSWRDIVPADRVLRARGPRMRSIPAYGQVVATDWGWASLHPSQEQTHLVAAFSTEAAEEKVFDGLPSLCGFVPAEVSLLASDPGRHGAPWVANCVAIGPASARFDPLHGIEMLGVQLSLVHLLSRFPATADFAAERRDYNEAMARLLDRLCDFQAAHYRLARYAGDFWDKARACCCPVTLAHKIDTFAARGQIAVLEDESFPNDSWHALFLGHGLISNSWIPEIDPVAPELMHTEFRRMLGFIKDKVLAQPNHDQYLAGLRPAAPR
ncbi:tryptophan 7-halogenase [Sphingomonas sp. JC676]|uniref:tryptophan 7-halogenase n=1 Tax=Sphingomonas sp. JC676 TaxID=2768065 RepID=UPI00165819C5|nr:tryptophan 7-halogenase [Sphingomonas sp. JC676]MBC9032164.1 tryptophan 7-halogenase [Sphingomonas sp. JC676]